MSFDHALRGEERFDFVAKLNDIVVFSEPIWPFGTKTKALEPETKTGFAAAFSIWAFITFLSSNSARVTTRLSAHSAFSLGRSGLLHRRL